MKFIGVGMGGLVLLLGVACGSSKGSSDASEPNSVSVEIGEEGGQVEGPGGVGLSVPPGALDEPVTITISIPEAGFESLPAVASGVVYAFEPHGQMFNLPVTISLPHTSNPDELAMFTSSPGGDWDKLVASKEPTALRAQVDHFSFFFNGREVCGLYRQECCEPSDGSDGECAGDALSCRDGRCLECGFLGEACCGGADGTCHDFESLATVCSDGFCQLPEPDAGLQPDAGLADAQGGLPDATPGQPDATQALPDAMP